MNFYRVSNMCNFIGQCILNFYEKESILRLFVRGQSRKTFKLLFFNLCHVLLFFFCFLSVKSGWPFLIMRQSTYENTINERVKFVSPDSHVKGMKKHDSCPCHRQPRKITVGILPPFFRLGGFE